MNEVMVNSMFDELVKIAQDVMPADPREAEMEDIQRNPLEPKDINREVLKQKLKDTAVIAGGAATGAGLGLGTNMMLEKALSRFGKTPPKWLKPAVMTAVVPAMSYGSHKAYSKMREHDRNLLEEARQRGENRE